MDELLNNGIYARVADVSPDVLYLQVCSYLFDLSVQVDHVHDDIEILNHPAPICHFALFVR